MEIQALKKPLQQLQRTLELSVTDPRNQSLISYPLCTLAVIIILARMSGVEDMEGIAAFYGRNKSKLKEYLYGLDDAIPSGQTFRRVQTILNTDNLLEYFTQYFVTACINPQLPQSLTLKERDVISCDGQNIKATRLSDKNGDKRVNTGANIIQLYSHKYGLTLAQKVSSKYNQESKAICDLIPLVNAHNCIFTWDAINTRHSTINAVINAGGDFLVALKANQETLLEEVVTAFQYCPQDEMVQDTRHNNGEHGRIEEKTISILPVTAVLSKEIKRQWPQIRSIIRVQTKRYVKATGNEQQDIRYFISSLEVETENEDFAAQMQDIILKRWSVETCHWFLDVFFTQDRLPLRNQDYIRNHTYFTKMAYNILSFVKGHLPEKSKGRTASMGLFQQACQDVEVSLSFIAAYLAQDVSALLEDERLYDACILKRPVVKDDYVAPKETVPESGLGRLAMLGKKGVKNKS